ncbi:MAG: NfeD family protein [Bdellovibrionales bacterium]
MSFYMIWLGLGVLFILLEAVIPGGIIVFLGLAAVVTSGLIYFGFITTLTSALISWFIISLLMLFILRSIFMKFFEGDIEVQNVDEENEYKGAIVEVLEDIYPHKEGRVGYRDSTWRARSDDKIKSGERAIIVSKDGNDWVVKSIY